MKKFDQIDAIAYNKLDTDYKAEVIAYHLWKYYEEIDYVFFKRLGDNNRSFHKDLKNIREEYIDVQERIVSVETYREGIYDYLPEGVFHPPSLKGKGQNIANVVEQIQFEKRVEQKAREFFQPFELEIYFSNLGALHLLDSFELLSNTNQLMVMLEELWPLLKKMEPKTAKVFACMLPHLHAARGDRAWMIKCLSAFLKVDVAIEFSPSKIENLTDVSSQLVLSEIQLGITSVLTGSHFDGERNWKFSFGPIDYKELDLYLEGSDLRKLLHVIYDYCLPITVTAEEVFVTNRNEMSFTIGHENTSLLGYSTYL